MSEKLQSSGRSAARVWFSRWKKNPDRRNIQVSTKNTKKPESQKKQKPNKKHNLRVDGIETVRNFFKKAQLRKIVASVMTRTKPATGQR